MCCCFSETCFFNRTWSTYNHGFITMLILQYANGGTHFMLIMTLQYIFQIQFELQPALVQQLIALTAIPWSSKLLFGIISDSLPICGSTRKAYLLLFSVMQLVSCLVIAIAIEESYKVVAVFSWLISLSQAFMDVVIDGVLVNQQKLDLERGSEDLQLYCWTSYVFGGLFFTVIAG